MKILSVDDNESNQYAIKKILERDQFEVIQASTGEEALAMLSQKPELVILDVNLPDISGFEICRRIKSDEQFSSIPVLHVSASFIQSKDKVTGLESGADGYLAQPIDSAVLIATVRSLIRIRKAEREKAQLIEELKLERETRERFVATLTHDLRSPLTAAKMSAQLLARSQNLNEREINLITRTISSISRTDLMIQDLLDVNLLRAGKQIPKSITHIQVNQLIQSVLEDFNVNFGGRFEYKPSQNLEANWDEAGVKRILENLFNNAVKYGDSAKPVEIKTGTAAGNSLFISVKNYGNVIPAPELQSLFDPFQRSFSAESSGKKGWGLGLALVKGVTESHGGTVSVTSTETAGTEFKVTLPVDANENR